MANIEAILSTISQKYISIHVIDIKNDRYEAIKSIEAIDKFSAGEASAQKALNNVMNDLAQGESKKIINEFTDLSTLEERLKEQNIIRSFPMQLAGVKPPSFVVTNVKKSPQRKLYSWWKILTNRYVGNASCSNRSEKPRSKL